MNTKLPLKTSSDEMGYGLTVLWLAVLTIFLGIAAMWNGHGFEGYWLLAFGVIGLLRAAKHVGEAGRLAAIEDEKIQREYDAWVEKVERSAE